MRVFLLFRLTVLYHFRHGVSSTKYSNSLMYQGLLSLHSFRVMHLVFFSPTILLSRSIRVLFLTIITLSASGKSYHAARLSESIPSCCKLSVEKRVLPISSLLPQYGNIMWYFIYFRVCSDNLVVLYTLCIYLDEIMWNCFGYICWLFYKRQTREVLHTQIWQVSSKKLISIALHWLRPYANKCF